VHPYDLDDVDDADMTQMIPYPPPSYVDTSLVYKQEGLIDDKDKPPTAPEPTPVSKEKITPFWKVDDLH